VSVDPALTADELAALAGPSVVRSYFVWDTDADDNVVATAQVDATVALTYPLPQITVRNTSAGWSDVTYNDTIFIGSMPGGFDRGIFRVRKPGTADTLEMMAIGSNDTGELAIATHNVAISDFDYITVLKRFDIFGVFPRIEYTTGTSGNIFEDWDKTVGNFNRYPPPRINVRIAGKDSNYAVHVYQHTSATFDVVLSIALWPTSSSATWAITLPAGVTLNSGSLTGSGTSATINVTVPHSAETYTFKFVATENNGSSFTSYRKVWVKSFTYPPTEIVRVESDSWDTTGAQMTLFFNSLVGLPPCAMVHYFEMDLWNGTDVPTACTSMTGYVIRQKEATDIGGAGVSLDIVGPSYVMDAIGGQSQIFSAVNTTPVTWQQLYYTLSYLDFVIWVFIAQRVAGLLQMFNYTPFGLSNTHKRMTDWRIDTGTLLSQVQSLAFRYGKGNFGCDPTGEVMLRRPPPLVPNGDRSGIATRISLNENIYNKVSLGRELRPRVRRLRGEAFYSDGLTTNTPVWCDAPPVPGQGQSEEKLEKQIVDTADELFELTGNDYAWRNNPYPNGSMSVPKNYNVVKPAQMLREYLNIPAAYRYDSTAFASHITINQVTRIHNDDGTVDTQYGFAIETVGLLATNVPIPAPDPSLYNSPYQAIPFAPLPFFQSPNPNPAGTKEGPQVVPRNGSVAFCGTETEPFLVTNFLGTPQYKNLLPSDLGSYEIKHGMVALKSGKAWLLASDGVNSSVWFTESLFTTPVVWSKGDDVTGIYDTIRIPDTSGAVMIYASDDTGVDTEINLRATNGGFVNVTYSSLGFHNAPDQSGTWVGGNGWEQTRTDSSDSPTRNYESIIIAKTFSPAKTFTRIIARMDRAIGSDVANITVELLGSLSGATQFDQASGDTGPVGTDVPYQWSGRATIDTLRFNQNCGSINNPPGGDPGGTCTLFKIILTEGGSNSKVAYSGDNGATFGTPIDLGSNAGAVGGFDVQHNGTVSYAAAENEIQKATTLGGSYSTDQSLTVSPSMIEIPWYTRNSLSSLNSGGSPEYIFGLPTPDGSGNTLYWVVSGTPVDITPTVGGYPGLALNANCLATWKGKYIAAVLSFNGVLHLVTSINGGTSWTDRGAVDADYVRVRRGAGTPGQIYAAGHVLKYSATFGKNLAAKTKPSSADLVFFEPIG
jgi:hypothetical protein